MMCKGVCVVIGQDRILADGILRAVGERTVRSVEAFIGVVLFICWVDNARNLFCKIICM